ncbi:MAG: cyclopropane-fatty-acyl-phospholipid synthase family protein [Solirubrobacterales bacterium]
MNSELALRDRPRLTPSQWIARELLRLAVGRVPVEVVLPDGSPLSDRPLEGDWLPRVEICDESAIYRRLAADPKCGIGESYVAGEWKVADGTDLADALLPFAEKFTSLLPRWTGRLRWLVDRPIPHSDRNSPSGSRRNVEAHYDLSNELFEAFLDPSMTYSSGLFAEDVPFSEQSLERAQERKIDRMLDAAGVEQGTRLLEIGTGWGALAIRAGQRGAEVHTITLSREQAELTHERVLAAGVADRVEIVLCDYREVRGRYDAVVSVEMLEAVGEEFWPDYFTAIDRLLEPGANAVIQSILMQHDRYLATRHSYGWIQKHIFPGGLIPSERAIAAVLAEHTELQLADALGFGAHYAETLRRWRRRFDLQWDQVAALGFDSSFRRKWEFYLAYCEAGFASGYLDVAQLTLKRRAQG